MAKGGRPRIKINWEDFDKLCMMQCTLQEIAGWFDCCEDTIESAVKRDKGEGFSDYHKKKSQKGKISLRRKQMEIARSGNVTMLIWLGKQYLSQKDRQELSGDSDKPISLIFNGIKELPKDGK